MAPGQEAQRVVCGIDSSMILTSPGRVLACGSNRYWGIKVLGLPPRPPWMQSISVLIAFLLVLRFRALGFVSWSYRS